MLLNCVIGEDSSESLGLQGDPTSPSWKKLVLNIHLMYWCWNWNFNTLAIWCKELTHLKITQCWERLKAKGDDRGWDGWMASLTQWTWVWVNSGREFVMDRESWHTEVYGGAKSWTQLSAWTELNWETSLVVQWLRLYALRVGRFDPWSGTRSYIWN